MFLVATLEKMLNAAPGRWERPRTVTRPRSFRHAAPQTGMFGASGRGRSSLPDLSLKLLRTWTGTLNFLGELMSVVHDAGPVRGQFEHLVVADLLTWRASGTIRGSGGVDAINVGVDLARIAWSHGRQRNAVVSLPPRPRVVMLFDSSIP